MELTSSERLSSNNQVPNFMKIRPVGAKLFHACGQMGRHDEANSRPSQFCEGARKVDHCLIITISALSNSVGIQTGMVINWGGIPDLGTFRIQESSRWRQFRGQPITCSVETSLAKQHVINLPLTCAALTFPAFIFMSLTESTAQSKTPCSCDDCC